MSHYNAWLYIATRVLLSHAAHEYYMAVSYCMSVYLHINQFSVSSSQSDNLCARVCAHACVCVCIAI